MQPQVTVLVEYQRSGGIAGRDDRLVVYSDGTATLTRRGATTGFTLQADSLARLRALLAEANFADMRAEYLPQRRGADLFEYVLIHGGRRVRTADTAVPPELQPLLQLLGHLVSHPG